MDSAVKQLIQELNDRYDRLEYKNQPKTCALLRKAAEALEDLAGQIHHCADAADMQNRLIARLENELNQYRQ